MKTTTKTEMAAQLEDAQGRIQNLRVTVETLNRLLDERARQLAAARTQTAAANALLAFAGTLPPKQLYRALARALHPDVGGETAQMQELTAAWEATSG